MQKLHLHRLTFIVILLATLIGTSNVAQGQLSEALVNSEYRNAKGK